MGSKLPESTRLTYARQLLAEAKSLVPGMERLTAIAVEMRADDLYRLLGYKTWETFCTEELGVSKWTANRLIAGTKALDQPKPKGAGQKVAAVQAAPIPALSTEAPAKLSEGSGPGMPQTRPGAAAPSDPSSGGADVQPPAGPTDEAPTSSPSAPPDPEEIIERDFGGTLVRGPRKYIDECKLIPLPERPPSDRQLAARVYAAMREVDPTDAGPVTTPEEATFLRQWAQRTLDAWKAVYAPPAPAEKPQRRQGTITRPADRVGPSANGANGISRPQAAVLAGRAIETPRGKRHALDCSCLGCKPAKAVGK